MVMTMLNKVQPLNKDYNPVENTDIKKFVKTWNNMYPWDYWWRSKHKVAFGSSTHRDMSHVDMLCEYAEYKMIEKAREQEELDKDITENDSLGLDNKKQVKMSAKERDTAFDNLNLEEFNK